MLELIRMNIQDFQSRISGSILGLECTAASQKHFDGCVAESNLGELNICEIMAGQHAVIRKPHHSDEEGVVLTSIVQGNCSLERKKDQFEFSAGQAFFCRSKEFYVIETSADIQLKSLFVPYGKIGSSNRFLLADLDSQFNPEIDNHLSSLIMPFLEVDTSVLETRVLMKNVESSLLGLISGALGHESSMSGKMSYILKEVIRLVESNLTEEHLNPSFIADKLGYSQRYLNKILKHRDMSLLKLIHQLRMEKIIEELMSEEAQEKPIYVISGKYCFYDNSHFSRQFKAYTGLSPKEYRQQKYTKLYT
jgi:AraC-like DNA-binding protein